MSADRERLSDNRGCVVGSIRPVGKLWLLDAGGFILNDAAPEKILSPYDRLVAQVRDAYLEHLGPDVRGVYIRGTVARGMALGGASDLDSFVLVGRDPETLDLSWKEGVAERLLSLHPYVTGIDLGCIGPEAFANTDRFSELGLLMATQTACVWGENFIPSLPKYRPGVLVANSDLCQIRPDIEEALTEIDQDPSPEKVRYWCRRIAKNIVRAGFSLTMLREKTYTRDLYPCYKAFARWYPGRTAAMRRSVGYALDPSSEASEVKNFLKDFGGWMVQEADRWLERHNSSRVQELQLSDYPEEVKLGANTSHRTRP